MFDAPERTSGTGSAKIESCSGALLLVCSVRSGSDVSVFDFLREVGSGRSPCPDSLRVDGAILDDFSNKTAGTDIVSLCAVATDPDRVGLCVASTDPSDGLVDDSERIVLVLPVV